MEKAIALLEVQAMTAAIEGLDAMVKAADVRLIHVEKRLGGRLVTVVWTDRFPPSPPPPRPAGKRRPG